MESDSVLLDENQWVQSGETYVSGEAFKSDMFLRSDELLDLFSETNSEQALYDLVNKLNGFFSAILKIDGTVYLVSDHVGSRVLFYYTSPKTHIISDSFTKINEAVDQEYPTENILEFLTATYVSGTATINSNIRKSLPGSIISLDTHDNTSQISQYFTYVGNNKVLMRSEDRIYSEWKEIIDSVSQRVAQKVNGNQIVIGLSGGYDSRLITIMLDRIGYDNIILYTLSSGKGRNYEKQVAQSVAADTGFDWIEISIDRNEVLKGYRSKQWVDIAHKLGMSGMSHTSPSLITLHDKISENKRVEDDGLLLIGHQLFGSGKFVIPEITQNDWIPSETLVKGIMQKHYTSYDTNELNSKNKRKIRENIKKTLDVDDSISQNEAFRTMEQWFWREKLPNYLNLRALPMMQRDVWYPLLDKELAVFWDNIPQSNRYNKKLYKKFVNKLYKETYDINRKTASQLKDRDKGCVENILISARNTPAGKYIENSKVGPYIKDHIYKYMASDSNTKKENILKLYEEDYRYAFTNEKLFVEKYPSAGNWRYFLAREYLHKLNINKIPNH